MNEQANLDNLKSNNQTLSSAMLWDLSIPKYFLLFFAITVCVLYLWGYWSTFKINILEYLSLPDVIKLSAYPICSSLILYFAFLVVLQLFPSPDLPLKFKDNPIALKFMDIIALLIVKLIEYFIVIIFIIAAYAFYKSDDWMRILIELLPLITIFFLHHFLEKNKHIESIIPNKKVRSIVVLVILLLPYFSYDRGQKIAKDLISGKRYNYIVSMKKIDAINPSELTQKLRFIGHGGEYFFMFSPVDHSVVVTKLKEDEVFVMNSYPQKENERAEQQSEKKESNKALGKKL